MAARKTTTETEKRTLEVRTEREGVFRIEIEAGWKVTFSKVNPQAGGYECMALRIYESEDKQRACFTNVVSFRDLAIPFQRQVKKKKERTASETGAKKQSHTHEAEVEYEWIDGDEF